jgi:Ca-activated chloride channel family protein
MRHVAAVVVVSCALISSAPAAQPAQPPTSEQILFVTVTDRDRHLVSGLTQQDFTVLDEGKPQPITSFDVTPRPQRVILLLDTSASMESLLDPMRRAAEEFLDHLAPGDQAAIGGFDAKVLFQPNVGLTGDVASLKADLRQLKLGGSTAFYNTLGRSIERLKTASGHRVIVAFTDLDDTSSLLEASDVTAMARAADVTIYVITAANDRPVGHGRGAALDYEAVKAMVADSGGQVLAVKRPVEWGQTVARVANEIHAQYGIGFSPAVRNGKVHKLEVKTMTKGQSVRTRKTYVSAPPGG